MKKIEKLEALRGFAALYVVFHHMRLYQYSKLGYLTSQGQAAVMLFFVLSGFVIFLSVFKYSDGKNFESRPYLVKRFRRIYPVLIVALALAYICNVIAAGHLLPVEWKSLFGNLLNLQDHAKHPGNWFKPYYNNGPLWSLSYEWWFYLLFIPVYKFVRPSFQKYAAVLISLFGFLSYLIFPNQASLILEYFIIWWCGAELARSWVTNGDFDKKTLGFIGLSLIGFLIILGLQLGLSSDFDPRKIVFSFHPEIEFRHFLYTAILLAVGFLWRRVSWIGYDYLLRPFIFLAPVSYGIYLFHAPLMLTINRSSIGSQLIGFLLCLVLAYLVEVKLQKHINRATQRFIVYRNGR